MKTKWSLILITVLACARAASGQLYLTQQGRALDANPGIGTGGFNTPQPGSALDGNLYVTGQVARGASFHGTTGYAGADQLRLVLPSSGLDVFIRDSVGVGQVRSGLSYSPGLFLSPNSTVLGPGQIARGLAAPGTDAPLRGHLSPSAAQRLYESAVEPYKPILAELSERLRLGPLGAPMRTDLAPPPQADPYAPRPREVSPEELLLSRPEEFVAAQQADRLRLELLREKPLDTAVKPVLPGLERRGAEAEPAEAAVADERLPEPGQDVFLDMLLILHRVRQEREAEARRAEVLKAAEPQPQAEKEPVPAERPKDESLLPQPQLRPRAEQPAVEWAGNQLLLHRLAGKGPDLFNRQLAQAEEMLADKRYLDAAERYQLAGLLNRTDPRGPIGEAVARLAAGEPRSAASWAREAIRRFPPVMDTRVDFVGMLGQDLVDHRLKELDDRLARQGKEPEAALVFLAAFVRANLGQTAKAADHARVLARLRDADKLEQIYAEHLLKPTAPKPE